VKYRGLILSPGPKTPKEAGINLYNGSAHSGRLPILGICLGQQSIGYAFGASIVKGVFCTGKISEEKHDGIGYSRV
jgi:anthranilate/para-aminobenzoate synthase component II